MIVATYLASRGGTATAADLGRAGFSRHRITSYNQVDNVEHVLVTSGTGVPTSALILAPS